MTEPGEFTRKVTFQQQAADGDGMRFGAFADVVTRQAKIVPKIGGETVNDQRLQGNQPVVIYVRKDSLTAAIDNSYRAVDARHTSTVWNVASVIWNEAEDMIEVLAVQRPGGSDV